MDSSKVEPFKFPISEDIRSKFPSSKEVEGLPELLSSLETINRNVSELDSMEALLEEKRKSFEEIKRTSLEKIDKEMAEFGEEKLSESIICFEFENVPFTLTTHVPPSEHKKFDAKEDKKVLEAFSNRYAIMRHPDMPDNDCEVFYEGFDQEGLYGTYRAVLGESEHFGTIRNFSPVGPNICVYQNGDKILGSVNNGQINGFAKFISGERKTYGELDGSGMFKGHCMGKHGTDKSNSQWTYGSSSGNIFVGAGIIIFNDGSYFEGIIDDLKFKKGTFYSKENNIILEGEFDSNNGLEGKGKLHVLSADLLYEGIFKNNKLNGEGTYTNGATKEVFKGTFTDNVINGEGIYQQDGKFKYEGSFLNGKMDGKGKFAFENGNIYDGDFKEGRFEGFGQVLTVEGTVLKGEFKDWEPAGALETFDKEGNKIEKKGCGKEGCGTGGCGSGSCGLKPDSSSTSFSNTDKFSQFDASEPAFIPLQIGPSFSPLFMPPTAQTPALKTLRLPNPSFLKSNRRMFTAALIGMAAFDMARNVGGSQ